MGWKITHRLKVPIHYFFYRGRASQAGDVFRFVEMHASLGLPQGIMKD
jgi:hypothetical protein